MAIRLTVHVHSSGPIQYGVTWQMKPTNGIIGKNAPPVGVTPAIILNNPKKAANVGAVIRAASCFGANQVWYSGNRFRLDDGERIPREERLRGYKEVDLIQFDYPFDHFPRGVTPVAIELVENAEWLCDFEHPEKAVYVFGPEDGSIEQTWKRHCHRFVKIPSKHCTNLSAAVYIVLYDRMMKHYQKTGELLELAEDRGLDASLERFGDLGERNNSAFI
jgi:tRNA(Leu) C34 or U34 (ribose-2'-O)-methylase TrmL